jgi:uncharacterized protein YjiS (DUF1127 family)
MEMVMSAILSTTSPSLRPAAGLLMLQSVVNGWRLASSAWWLQQRAGDRLKPMSDRQLADIGLSREQIECVDRGDLERDRVLIHYF